MSCVTLLKAALARLVFATHALVTIWRVVSEEGDHYWRLAITVLILLAEGVHALCYRKGQELSFFCPSVFIYLCSMIPAIWILELRTNRREMLCLYIELVQQNLSPTLSPSAPTPAPSSHEHLLRYNMLLDIMQMTRRDLEEASEACNFITISEETRRRYLSNEARLKKILDINVTITLKPEQWTRILEQVVLVVLILGRWLLPKGKLTRDQFSQLLLVFIGMAADIVEIFEAFRESKVMLEPILTYAILGVWSWSLLQFCLVLGSAQRPRKSRFSTEVSASTEGSIDEEKKKRMQMDMATIITALVLQDLPFFCLRIMLIFRFQVISQMNIFFTCKNSLVILLQIYRLTVLFCEQRPQYRRRSRLFSLIPVVNIPSSVQHSSEDEEPSLSDSEEERHYKENFKEYKTQNCSNKDSVEKEKNIEKVNLVKKNRLASSLSSPSTHSSLDEAPRRNRLVVQKKRSRATTSSATTTRTTRTSSTTCPSPATCSSRRATFANSSKSAITSTSPKAVVRRQTLI